MWSSVFLAMLLFLNPDAASSFHREALELSRTGRFAEAGDLYGKAIAIWKGLGRDYQAHLAASLTNLGQTRQNSGDWDGAISAYREAMTLSSGKDARSAAVMSRLGGALAATARVDEAEPLLQRALGLQEAMSPADPETGNTLNNLAVLYAQLGRWKDAEPLVERAADIFNQATGRDSLETAMLVANIASIHVQQGRYDRAEPLLRRARITYERTGGGDQPQLAMVLSQEGLLLLHQNKHLLARKQLLRAVEILRKTTGTESLDTSVAETNLALAFVKMGKIEEAVPLLTHSLSVQERLYDRPTRELDTTRATLAECRQMAQSKKGRPSPSRSGLLNSLN